MVCKQIQLLSLVLLSFGGCFAQEPTNSEPILGHPESYQRKFVADFLKDGNAAGHVEGYPRATDHNSDFRILTKLTDWALPMAEARIVEWLREPEPNLPAIENVTESILYSGTIQSLDFVVRVFANTPEAHRWIRKGITYGFGSPDPNFITKWYYALDSPTLLVREIALEAISQRLTHPIESTIVIWGEAMVVRYKREPTVLEMLTDPLVEIARRHSDVHPEVLRERLKKSAREAISRIQAGQKKTK
jgi:hypothetical protein